jgi:hypothetical protein
MKRTCVIFSDFFVNFVSSYVRYMYSESMCTGYVFFFISVDKQFRHIFSMRKLYNIYKSIIVYDYVLHRHIIYLQVLTLVINMILC